MDPDGNDVAVHAEGEAAEEEGHGDTHGEPEEQNCHFHAGVEYDPLDFMLNFLLLTRVTGTVLVLVVRAKVSLAAFASVSTTSDCELVRSS